ncbi:porin family protein [Piscinibacter terrae]|uniref:Uncharacterized protein n=1 Tax=Piscinibacter terrae TaxID=2496871 RepID=A0A3N7HHA7_9BURK|nr:hypothetical protein [Albitalea terrae]RQP21424.1 hypothetical protein DZC73_28525 [Albitalea terrae]
MHIPGRHKKDHRTTNGRRLGPLQAPLLVAAMVLGKPAFAEGASGVVMLDYQAIKVEGYPSIDLVGFHVLNKFNDWLSVGVGGHAPLFKGDYGGFMAFDATVHAERRLFGNLSAAAGLSLGGGGGGKNVEQSKIISGSGGFTKGYVGLGYRFSDLSVGLTYSRIRFTGSVIDGSQFGLYVQAPFSYAVGPYEDAGRSVSASPASGAAASDPSVNNTVSFGLDNIIQIHPKGTSKQVVNLVDAQYNHFVTPHTYLLFGGSVGYHGLAGYNQVFGGVGYRQVHTSRLSSNVQLAVGSGGYAPEKIDTGPGLLIYPKLSTEYRFSDTFGLALSAGYLYAPRGSSRNVTLGASLVYHGTPNGGSPGDSPAREMSYRGHRFHTFLQTGFNTQVGDRDQGKLKLLSVQIDNLLRDNLYIPIQGSIAYGPYLGYPGYGEVLTGLGVQSRYSPGDTFQTFAQVLVGTNIHGLIARPSVGVNLGLSDRFALYGQVGGAVSLDSLGVYPKKYKFRSTSIGVGVSYRFSLPQ